MNGVLEKRVIPAKAGIQSIDFTRLDISRWEHSWGFSMPWQTHSIYRQHADALQGDPQ